VNVLFLVPDIHDLQTGGNVFNRRIIEGLRPDRRKEVSRRPSRMRPEMDVRVVPWNPGETSVADLELSDADVVVADSLLAQHSEALRTVQGEHPAVTLILLVHYLHCIDPRSSDTAVAADERDTLNAVDAAITTSRFVRRALGEEGLSAERVKVVRPGLDERYRGAVPLRLGRDAPRILTVANLLPEKGLQPFVQVLRDLQDLPWTWTLVGDASLDPAYAAGVFRRLQSARLSDRVTWTGAIAPEALRTQYDRADLFVLPSRFETCSLSTREAMACGLPVVGYRVGGLPENFGDAAVGHLVPPGNASALRAALRSLLTDPMARAQRGITAWQRSRMFPRWEKAAERFHAALASLNARAGDGTA